MQKHVNKKILLGMAVVFAFLLGTFATPVVAYQTNMVYEAYNQAFTPEANNHTYVYVPYEFEMMHSSAWIHVTEDFDLTRYRYDETGWSSPDTSYTAPWNGPFNWQQYQPFANGPFGNPSLLPVFFDFVGSDGGPAAVNTTVERMSFSLAFGQHTPVVVDENHVYFGALSVSGQEYVHLYVDSLQDGVAWDVAVFDPEGRYMGGTSNADGDIWVIPFCPSTNGVYTVVIMVSIDTIQTAVFDFYPVAVSPRQIALNEIVTGYLPTGELAMLEETGSWVHKEMAPTVHTYKFQSPRDVAALSFYFNYPEMFVGVTQPPSIMFTSKAFVHDYQGGSRYLEGETYPDSGTYYYREGPFYVTLVGGDALEYTLYNYVVGEGDLIVNEAFLLENYYTSPSTHVYRLNLVDDSILRVNATIDDFDIWMNAVYEDGYRFESSISYSPTIGSAVEYYLPAGEYTVVIDVDANSNGEYLQFNIAPILSATTADIVDLGGFALESAPHTWYNLTVALGNQDNVTVSYQMLLYDRFGTVRYDTSFILANRWDGSSIQPHPSYENTVTLSFLAPFTENAFISLCPYNVANNTETAVNVYADYPVDTTIEWVNAMSSRYIDITSMDVSAGSISHNFTMALPDYSPEYYGVQLTASTGTWYNVSIKTASATNVQVTQMSAFELRTHQVAWGDLDDTLTGIVADMSFQFGAIAEDTFLHIRVTRPLASEGFLWVEITPFETHQLAEMAPLRPRGGDLFGALGAIIPIAGGVLVIVVVAVVYVKRYRT